MKSGSHERCSSRPFYFSPFSSYYGYKNGTVAAPPPMVIPQLLLVVGCCQDDGRMFDVPEFIVESDLECFVEWVNQAEHVFVCKATPRD